MFIVFFHTNQNLGQKTITFDILQNTGSLKKTVLLQPPFWPKNCVFQFCFFETKKLTLNKKHNLKSGKKQR